LFYLPASIYVNILTSCPHPNQAIKNASTPTPNARLNKVLLPTASVPCGLPAPLVVTVAGFEEVVLDVADAAEEAEEDAGAEADVEAAEAADVEVASAAAEDDGG
jgi:hypothetical protein